MPRPKGFKLSEESKELIRQTQLKRWAIIRELLEVDDLALGNFEDPEAEDSAESA